ncbi:hypothetical protein DSM03_1011071 [Leeuwenhoekiella aestuarii]|uniref:Cro/C1-type helix-turn-helix DNA-binding protein n=1 Tax=Leeuwenhoekiella aestuarii TaxID=2249426 RepID=A0A4Q0P2F9_9FLAO|nr:transcriptional regulator [Leeuwenhoekiella aestuarii]RXG18389.1 hypothetical protein DSM04_101582 [Leeuwenhoekiella aestuarii]RXG19694.1 hypothetical protein DSM03_1011071 [Leeuwenhoekiella aestuarii]
MNINFLISNAISEWIKDAKSNRDFALNHNIDEKIVRRILDEKEYRIPVETLKRICDARQLKLSDFFSEIKE